MPPEAGMIFVVILRLAPDPYTNMPELLGQCTPMAVRQAKHGEKVEVHHVYVIPPGKFLLTVGGQLRLRPLEPERRKR